MTKLADWILLALLRPIAIALSLMRKASRRILLATQRDYFLARRKETLRYKIVRHLRTPFALSIDKMRLTWYGKTTTVDLTIPKEVSLCEARAVILAQRIDPWLAEQLFISMGTDEIFVELKE